MTNERIADLLELTDEDPDDVLAHFMLAQEYVREKLYDDAVPYFEIVLDMDPSYSAAYRGLGKCLKELGDAERAEPVLRKGMEIADAAGDLQTWREMKALLKRMGLSVED